MRRLLSQRSFGRLLSGSLVVVLLSALAVPVLPARLAWAAGGPDEPCPSGGSHVFQVTITRQATDDVDGVMTYVCKKCGYAFTMPIPHTGHDWGPWIVDVEPTCTTRGSEHRECHRYPSQTHYEYQELPALSATGEHTWGDWVTVTAPTATSEGLRRRACSVCGATESEPVPAVAAEPESPASAGGADAETASPDDDAAASVAPRTATAPTGQDQGEADDASPPDEGQRMLGPFVLSFEPNATDAVALAGDGIAIGVSAAILAPMLPALWWARRRKREALERYLERAAAEPRGVTTIDESRAEK